MVRWFAGGGRTVMTQRTITDDSGMIKHCAGKSGASEIRRTMTHTTIGYSRNMAG